MQPTFREIKSVAKSSLKQHWPEAIAVALVYIATTLLNSFTQSILMTILKVDAVWSPLTPTDVPISYSQLASLGITVFSAIFSLGVTLPLAFGIIRWFWQLTGGQSPSASEVFFFFSSSKAYFRILRLSIALYLILILGAIVCFLPFVVVELVTTPHLYDALKVPMPMIMESLSPLAAFFELFGFLAFLLWISSYILCFTVTVAHPELNVRQILRLTKKAVKGFRLSLICFGFSFFGWLLLCVFVIPIGYVIPYFLAAFTVFGREALRTYNRRLENASES